MQFIALQTHPLVQINPASLLFILSVDQMIMRRVLVKWGLMHLCEAWHQAIHHRIMTP